tara:strand:+ start:25838 stop:26350 length:513 start_codon:yes stop_codon:yes gene_type:complete
MVKKKEEKRIVWTTKKVEEAAKKLNDGYILPNYEIPFWEKTVGLRKAGISFGFTDMELDEYTKCKIDIRHFANNYCFIKTEDGSFKVMNLRDYQYDILDLYDDNKFSILMASRQVGKCFIYNTELKIYNKKTKVYENIKFFRFIFKIKKKKTIYNYLKYFIYTLIDIIDG